MIAVQKRIIDTILLFIKRNSRFLKKLNMESPYDPAILLLGLCPKELKAKA